MDMQLRNLQQLCDAVSVWTKMEECFQHHVESMLRRNQDGSQRKRFSQIKKQRRSFSLTVKKNKLEVGDIYGYKES